MARTLLQSRSRPTPRLITRPRLEVLEDRTVLSGGNSLPHVETESHGNMNTSTEVRQAESTPQPEMQDVASVLAPEASLSQEGGDLDRASNVRSGGDPPPGFFYVSGPGYPLLPIALKPLFSSGGNQEAQQAALVSLSSPVALVPVRPHLPDAVALVPGTTTTEPVIGTASVPASVPVSSTTPTTEPALLLFGLVAPSASPASSSALFSIRPTTPFPAAAIPAIAVLPDLMTSSIVPLPSLPVSATGSAAPTFAFVPLAPTVSLAQEAPTVLASATAVELPARESPGPVALPVVGGLSDRGESAAMVVSDVPRAVQASVAMGKSAAVQAAILSAPVVPPVAVPTLLLDGQPAAAKGTAHPAIIRSEALATQIPNGDVAPDNTTAPEEIPLTPAPDETRTAEATSEEDPVTCQGCPACPNTAPLVDFGNEVSQAEPAAPAASRTNDAVWILAGSAVLAPFAFALALHFTTRRTSQSSEQPLPGLRR